MEAEIKSDVSTETNYMLREIDNLLNQELGSGMTVRNLLSKSVEVRKKWQFIEIQIYNIFV